MNFRLNELKGKLADSGRSMSWEAIAEETGISKQALIALSKGTMRAIQPVYVDILCKFFNVSADGLIALDDVDLPYELNLRPDRHGVPVRKQTKTQQAAPTPPATTQRVTLDDIERLRKAKRDELKPKEPTP